MARKIWSDPISGSMMKVDNVIKTQKVKQNNQEFLIGVFTIGQILKFTRYTERLIVNYDDNNFPIYNKEIQRKTEKSRVDKIADFLINDPDATFPTNIVLAVPGAVIEHLDEEGDMVSLTLNRVVFDEVAKPEGDVHLTIIDGQHRIKGIEQAIWRLEQQIKSLRDVLRGGAQNNSIENRLSHFSKRLKELKEIELMVSFFVDPTLEFQAMIFSTINRTQKSVPQSLVYELFGLSTGDSPQKTALQITLSLNSYENSPFYNRVKLHGGSYAINQSPPLTQSMMVKSIIDRISVNIREAENDRFRSRKELLKGGNDSHIFRKYYARNEDDKIADIMFSYFEAVRRTFQDANGNSLWEFPSNVTKPQNILHTTVGYQALLILLAEILSNVSTDKRDDVNTYQSFLKKAKGIDFFNIERYPFTSKSRKIFYYDLNLRIWPPKNNQDERVIKLNDSLSKL
ncbi:DGQHR domain-containing protein [Croceitalea marina]|uniref:DGQHR domain-containing protein n=1 Tax=Croceitalea marina TaxID=1775166 RepID=A0ABW5MWN9_9FLAO